MYSHSRETKLGIDTGVAVDGCQRRMENLKSTIFFVIKECLDWMVKALFVMHFFFSTFPVGNNCTSIAWHIIHSHQSHTRSQQSRSSFYLIQCHSRYDSVSFACRKWGQCLTFNPYLFSLSVLTCSLVVFLVFWLFNEIAMWMAFYGAKKFLRRRPNDDGF